MPSRVEFGWWPSAAAAVSLRSSSQMISYEVFMGLSILGLIVQSASSPTDAGGAFIGGSMISSAGSLGPFLDVPSALVVLGGTFFAVMWTTPLPAFLGHFGAKTWFWDEIGL